jgi:hypothetical protein
LDCDQAGNHDSASAFPSPQLLTTLETHLGLSREGQRFLRESCTAGRNAVKESNAVDPDNLGAT